MGNRISLRREGNIMTKREYIIELIRLTKLQAEALEKEEVEEFIGLLDKRQEVLELIQTLHEQYPETREQHEEELINELKTLDAKNRIEFERQLEAVKEKLREVRQMKAREACYGNPYDIAREEGMFFDKRGPQ